MPNYREAQWAGEWLEDHVVKPVYVDQSSSSEATTEMLQSFFNDEHAIFITSSLGTVTEGVDYDGEKLHCATVVGVPYRNIATGRSQAVIDAYDRKVADESQSGFETAVAIPAVRKARQAIGRVLRAPSETGVRVFLDRRYGQRGPYNVGQHLSSAEFDEFQTIQPDMLPHGLSRFWEEH
jgi:DNA excision repair protein ERCC-2